MNSFGLGLVLNFTDNASAGMMGVIGTFGQLNSAADGSQNSLTTLGGAMTTFGGTLTALTAPLTAFIGKMWSAGLAEASFIQNTAISLETFLGSAEAATQHLGAITKFSYDTPFNYESLVAASQSLLVMGQNTEEGIATLKLLGDTAGALGKDFGFVEGVLDIMGKINAEGKVTEVRMQQLRKTGMDLTNIEKGMTANEVWEQLNINLAKYEGNMDKILGTWSGAVDYFESAVAVAGNYLMGVYYDWDEETQSFVSNMEGLERLTAALRGVGDFIFALAPALAPLGETVISFLEMVVGWLTKLSEWYENATEAQQGFVGQVVKFLVLGGPLLMLGGKLITSLGLMAMGGKAAASSMTLFGKAVSLLSSPLVVLAASALIFFTIWNNNLGGLRDRWEETFGRIIGTFSILKEYFSEGGLSYESFLKMQDLGVQPLVEGIIRLSEQFSNLWTGFKEGIVGAVDGIVTFLDYIGVLKKDNDGLTTLGNFLKTIADPENADRWIAAGKAIGTFVVALAGLSIITKIATMFSGLGKIFSIFGGKSGGTPDIVGGANSAKGFSNILLNPKTVLKGMSSVAIIIGGFALIVMAFATLSRIPGFNEFLSGGMKTLATLFTGVLPMIAGLAALNAFVVVLDKLKVSPAGVAKGIANLAIILGGFALLVTAVGALASIPGFSGFMSTGGQSLQQLMGVISVDFVLQLAALSVVIVALGFATPATVLSGLAGLALIIGGFGLIVAAFGALSLIPGYSEFMSNGGAALAQLFGIMGEVIGSFVGGIAVGLTDGLPQIGQNLADFGNNVKPFFDAVATAPLDSLGSFLTSFGAFMLMLGGEAILSFFTGGVDLPGLGAELSTFGTSAAPFFEAVASYPEDGITKAPAVFEGLAGAGQFTSGGVVGWWNGELAIGALGEQLASFAPHGTIFFTAVAGYPDEGIEKAPSVFDSLAGAGKFTTGGVTNWWNGELAIGALGVQLAAFAPNAAIFFNEMSGVSVDGIDNGRRALEALALAGGVEFKSGGIIEFFTGSTNLGNMGKQLSDFGSNASGFFTTMSAFSADQIENGYRAIEALSILGNGSFNSGGLAELMTGSIDLTTIGEQLTGFAIAANTFFAYAANFTASKIENGRAAIEVLTLLDNPAFKSGGMSQFFTGEVDLSVIGDNLSGFATSVQTFFTISADLPSMGFVNGKKLFETLALVTDLVDISFKLLSGGDLPQLGTDLSAFMTNSQGFFSIAATTSAEGVAALTPALSDFLGVLMTVNPSIISETSTGLDTLGISITTFITTLEGVPLDLMSNIASSITSNSGLITNAVGGVTSAVKTSLSALAASGSTYGYNLVTSIAQGVRNGSGVLSSAVRSAVNSAMSQVTVSTTTSARTSSVQAFASGGETFGTGLALLHPNEVVVNSDTTESLKRFLNEYNNGGAGSSPLTVQRQQTTNGGDEYDYSVTFAAGSIVFQMTGKEDEATLREKAEVLMKEIERLQKLKGMSQRQVRV